jgi:hypothetical protein
MDADAIMRPYIAFANIQTEVQEIAGVLRR